MPMLTKFLFLVSHGLKRSLSQAEKKEFKLEGDIKSSKLLKDSGFFEEGMGAASSGLLMVDPVESSSNMCGTPKCKLPKMA